MLKLPKIIILITLLACSVAAEDSGNEQTSSNSKYYFGVRIGSWINNGEQFPELHIDPVDNNYQLKTSIPDVNAYLDFFFGTRLFKHSYLEFSVGMVNRGTVKIQDYQTNDIGNLIVYNFMVQYKLYPNLFPSWRLQPYLGAGGGLHYARRSIQFTNSYLHSIGYGDESKANLNLTASAGTNWLLSEKLSLNLDFKYLPITFSKPLVTVKDYSAVTIAVGLVYRYQ